MSRPTVLGCIGLAALLAAAIVPAAPAAANEFCVAPASGCAGGQRPTLQSGLDAALASAGHDVVRLPAGVVQGPGKYESVNPDNSVDIVGAGRDATTITSASAERILEVNQESSLVSDLTVSQANPPPAFQQLGFVTGTIERVGLVSFDAFGSMSVSGTAREVVASGPSYFGIFGTLEDADLRGTSLSTRTSDTVVRRTRVEAPNPVYGQNHSLVISSSLFISTSATGYIASFSPSPVENSQATVLLSNVTMIGPGSPSCVGLGVSGDNVYPPPNDHAVESVTMASSIVRGCGTSIRRESSGGNRVANVTVFGSDVDLSPGAVAQSGAGTLTAGPGDGNVNTDPLFVGLPGFAQALRFDSPLVDQGLVSSLSAEESSTDLFGNPRVVDGNGDGTATRDIGAIEYQRSAPAVTVSAPSGAVAGEPVAFDGSATDADPGEEIASYSWAFDDGTGASGASASHPFATPGRHTVTLTATDSAGVSGSAEATVSVVGGAVRSISVSPRRFRAAAKGASFTARAKSAGGAKVRVKLSGPSDLRLTVQRRAKGRRAGKRCVKPAKGKQGGRPCTRLVTLPGHVVRAVGAPLRFHFSGRWHGAPLPPGRYLLTARGGSGKAKSAAFRVAR